MRASRRVGLALVVAVALAAGVVAHLSRRTPTTAPPSYLHPEPPRAAQADLLPQIAGQPADLTAWFETLSRQRAATIPEIIQLLRSGKDAPIAWIETPGDAPEWKKFTTLRTALLALLGEIGGAEATAYMRETVTATRDPVELALAAKLLDEQEPSQHREACVAAARQLLAGNPAEGAPLLQLLALFGRRDAVADVERFARQNPDQTDAAVAALTLLRNDGGDASLVALWRRDDLPSEARLHVAYGLGVAAPGSAAARETLQELFFVGQNLPARQRALEGLAAGESYLDERLLPRRLVAMGLPHSQWLADRVVLLDGLERGGQDAQTARLIQKVRDELTAELERTE